MHSSDTLQLELNRFHELRRRLIAEEPEIDETTLADTLEGATSLHEGIGAVIRSALEDEAVAQGLRGRIDQMEERLGRIETRAQKKRELVLTVMAESGIDKLMAPDFTASLRPSPPSVVVTDETLVPEWFWVPQAPKLDRRRMLEVLKCGQQVLGAELANPRLTLSVRTK
jgi:hypothetical protein